MDTSFHPFDTRGFEKALRNRQNWDGIWQDCYDFAMPQRGQMIAGPRRGERLYDATALDSVDALSSLLLGNLTPPMMSWFGFKAGTDIPAEQAQKLNTTLEKVAGILQSHFDHSNFVVEFHQSLLDLVVAGTACLAIEESEPGDLSALTFTSVPIQHVLLEEGKHNRLEVVYRPLTLTLDDLLARYPLAVWPENIVARGVADPSCTFDVIESCIPRAGGSGFTFQVYHIETNTVTYETVLADSPFINFRWMKSPGESYGRSPVMKALPDIKTANKVVELILKNASISVTGIWQAEDDGVLNPATIELIPGAIIPKAVGSKGLTPLDMPSRFDVSQIIFEDLRGRIRHALLADHLPSLNAQVRTATEVTERSNEMSLLLGATFGRLQVELITPLIQKAYHILRRRGVIPDLPLDGRTVMIDYRSPLARSQSTRSVQSALSWIQTVNALGPDIANRVDREAVLDYMNTLLGIPNFIKSPETTSPTHLPTNEEK